MRFVVTSDTHTLHDRVPIPEADVLLHCGDFTGHGSLQQIENFNAWLGTVPCKERVVIAGNHDFELDRKHSSNSRARYAASRLTNCTYLLDEEVRIGGLRIWGAPHQPAYGGWAFNLERGAEIKAKWNLIPTGIDIVMTHGPPLGFGDRTARGEHVGCADLLDAIRRVKPRYHVFGHIHEAMGLTREGETVCINASALGERTGPTSDGRVINPPFVFDLEPRHAVPK